jgi:hypothetical protein
MSKEIRFTETTSDAGIVRVENPYGETADVSLALVNHGSGYPELESVTDSQIVVRVRDGKSGNPLPREDVDLLITVWPKPASID